jgi:hypothetical protein
MKAARRASVSGGKGRSRIDAPIMTPHGRPSSVIAAPTPERALVARTTAPSGPELSA